MIINVFILCLSFFYSGLVSALSTSTSGNEQIFFVQYPLHDAIRAKDETRLDMLLKHESLKNWLNAQDGQGYSALMLAIETGQTRMAEKIIARGPNLGARENFLSKSALHLAVQTRNLAITRLLLEKGANIHQRDKQNASPFHILFLFRDGDNGQLIADFINLFLIEFEGDPYANHEYVGAPIEGIKQSKFPELDGLKEKLNSPSPAVRTSNFFIKYDSNRLYDLIKNPTVNRSWEEASESIQWLLTEGHPDINLVVENMSLLEWAISSNYEEAALKLLNCPGINLLPHQQNEMGFLALASMNSSTKETVKKLLALGVDVEGKDKFQRTALMMAADENITELLLKAGANVNAQDHEGKTALHYVAAKNKVHVSWIKKLLDAGADSEIRTKAGKTALDVFNDNEENHLFSSYAEIGNLLASSMGKKADDMQMLIGYPLHNAALSGDANLIKKLLSENENIFLVDSEGKTALHVAVIANNNKEVIEALLSNKNANRFFIDMQDNDGFSAFHYAVQNKDVSVAKRLEKSRANIYLVTKKNENALHLAAKNNDENLTPFLLKRYVDVWLKNNDGKTPSSLMRNVALRTAINDREDELLSLFTLFKRDQAQGILDFCAPYYREGSKKNKYQLRLGSIMKFMRDEFGESLVKRATENKATNCLLALIQNGAEFYLSANDKVMETLLFEKFRDDAIKIAREQSEAVKELRRHYEQDSEDDFKKYILDPANKVDVETRIDQEPLLHKAILDARLKLADFLIEQGADIYARNKDGRSIIELIFMREDYQHFCENVLHKKHEEIETLFTRFKNLYAPEEIENFKNNFKSEMLKLRDAEGKTLLMTAARSGRADLMKFILEKGAPIFSEDYYGLTASDWAKDSGEQDAIDCFPPMNLHQLCNALYSRQLSAAAVLIQLTKLLQQERQKNAAPKQRHVQSLPL